MTGLDLPPGYEPPAAQFDRWREVGPGVLVRRHRSFDLNVTLVLGDDRVLVVDTHAHDGYARELVGAIRSVTGLPWVVVLTHAHFDHSFGCATFAAGQPGLEIWSHQACHDELAREGGRQREVAAAWLRRAGREDDAVAVRDVHLAPPTRTFTTGVEVDLGGRRV